MLKGIIALIGHYRGKRYPSSKEIEMLHRAVEEQKKTKTKPVTKKPTKLENSIVVSHIHEEF